MSENAYVLFTEMRIADRYIGWQVLFGTLFGVTLLSAVLILAQLFREIRPLLVEQAAPLSMIGKFMLLVVPFSLVFTLPWGFLASTLLSFGRLSTNNELLSLRMAGWSLTRVAFPVFLLGGALSLLCVYLTGTLAPNAKAESRKILWEAVRKDPRALLDPGVIQSRLPNKRVYVERREKEGVLDGIHLYELTEGKDAEAGTYYFARSADLFVDNEKQQLRLRLKDAYIEEIEDGKAPRLLLCGQAEPLLIDFADRRKKKNKASDVANADIPDAIERSKELQVQLEGTLDDPDLTDEEVSAIRKQISRESERQSELRVEVHKRHSLSMACLAFAMIGIPLGINARRRENNNGLLLSLLVAAVYFGVLIIGEQFSNAPTPVLITVLWLPNILCFLLGIWLFRRASFR